MKKGTDFPVLSEFTTAFYKPVNIKDNQEYARDLIGHVTTDNEMSLFSQLERGEMSVSADAEDGDNAILTAKSIRMDNDAVADLIYLASQFNKHRPLAAGLTGKLVGGIETSGYYRRDMFICANLMDLVTEAHFFAMIEKYVDGMLRNVRLPGGLVTKPPQGIKAIIATDAKIARYLEMRRQQNPVVFKNDIVGEIPFEVVSTTNIHMLQRVFVTLSFPDIEGDPRPTSFGNIVYIPDMEHTNTGAGNTQCRVFVSRYKLVCVNPMLAEIFIKL